MNRWEIYNVDTNQKKAEDPKLISENVDFRARNKIFCNVSGVNSSRACKNPKYIGI